MNTNFDDLPSLNDYLANRLDKIDRSKDKHAEINKLIQVMRHNEGLLHDEENYPQEVVDYLKISTAIRHMTKSSNDLERVTRAASNVLSHLGTSVHIEGHKRSVDPVKHIFNQLSKVDRETYLETLAGWINQNKIPLSDLHLPNSEMLELAPHLKILALIGNDYSEEFVGQLLEKAEQLNSLAIIDSDIDGSAFYKLKNSGNLKNLEVENCPNFNKALPSNFDNLRQIAIARCKNYNQPFPKTMDHLSALIIEDCKHFNQPLPKGAENLKSISLKNTAVNTAKVMKFLVPIFQQDREHALKLGKGMLPPNPDLSRQELIEVYEHFMMQNPKQSDAIADLVEKLNPVDLIVGIEDLQDTGLEVEGDPLQNVYICAICSKLPENKAHLLKKVLEPIMKSPMDPPLQELYARLASFKKPEGFLKFLKGVTPPERMLEAGAYNDLLAAWISKIKLPLSRLGLPQEALLELAPHLTYLDLSEKAAYSPKDKPKFSSEFLGKLLEKTEKLETLKFKNSKIDGAALSKLQNTQHLTHFIAKDCPALQRSDLCNFLASIYRVDPDRAVRLAQLHNRRSPIYEAELLQSLFESHDPSQADAIEQWMGKITVDKLRTLIIRNDIPFVHEDVLRDDPLQQLCIYHLCAGLSAEKLALVRQFLTPIIKSPMDAPLLKFYESIPSDISEKVLEKLIEITSKPHFDRDRMLKLLPCLTQENAVVAWVEKNLENLEVTGHLDLFLDKFPGVKEASIILATEDLFTEESQENEQKILKLFDSETKFKKEPIENITSEALESWAKDPLDSILVKLHFHDLVNVPDLQESVLKAFPPSKPENLALYPKESFLVEGMLDIKVVPTLPVADAPNLLRTIVSSGDIDGIHIYYYGSPGADASGLGRQFVSEVIQGYVIGQGSLFTRMAEGEMYPYDSTHRQRADANRESYHDLGKFLGMAMQWQFPTGKVLSEKALNCMLDFTSSDLKQDHLDSGAFFAKMDSAAFIQFMKQSSNDDEESIKIYEKLFLSDNPEEILASARLLNDLIGEDEVDEWIAGGAGNIKQIQERLRAIWVEDHEYSLSALFAMAQGISERLPRSIGDQKIFGWEDVRRLGAAELSKNLQGVLTAQFVKEHIHIRIIGSESPESLRTATDVRKWTDEWLEANGGDPDKLANFVQAFTGARAMTKDINLDINSNYKTIEAHTCFYRADIPPGVKESFLKLMWDDYATGNFKFNVA